MINEGYEYSSRVLIDKDNPVELYRYPKENTQPDFILEKLHDIEGRGVHLDVFGVNIYNVKEGWYEVKRVDSDEYFWINPEDTGTFVNYFDLLDNWQNLANNSEGYPLHQEPNDASATKTAIGFGPESRNKGSLYVEVLEQKYVDDVLWFKVAEITSELCERGYPWQLRSKGWIRAHFPNGDPVFDSFEIC